MSQRHPSRHVAHLLDPPLPLHIDAALRHQVQVHLEKSDPKRVPASSRLFSFSGTIEEETFGKTGGKKFQRRGRICRWLRRRPGRGILVGVVLWVVYLALCRLLNHPTLSLVTPEEGNDVGSTRANVAQPRSPIPWSVVKRLPAHDTVDGRLRVNVKSNIHPIYQLIHDARKEWDDKVARQSKTLKEAVEEYKRRYKMLPPRGFEKWWAYACTHNVSLPDEYDQIHNDILPFFALSPSTLIRRISEAAQLPDTYTLSIKHGSLRARSAYSRRIEGADQRLEGQAMLIRDVAKWLPDTTLVFSVHDTPRSVVSWDHRRELLERIGDDEYLDEDEEIDTYTRGFAMACPTSSPIKRLKGIANINSVPDTSNKSFVSSHSLLMDICQHPSLLSIHGALIGQSPVAQPLTPIISLSKTRLHSDILGVPIEQWVDTTPINLPWERKKKKKLLWRGSNTGAYHSVHTSWRQSHRARLLAVTNMMNDKDKVEMVDPNVTEKIHMLAAPKKIGSESLIVTAKTVELEAANIRYMDTAFTGSPIQCDKEDDTCENLASEFPWLDSMSHEEALNYKYVLDIDGNAWSARFKRLLASESLIFKATIMPEWWTDRIQPWVHYVPVQMDYSDLYDTLAFFEGDLYHTGGETLLARTIAEEGKEWSKAYWRKEDMTAYMFRLYLEWGRLSSLKRSKENFIYEESMEQRRQEV
nr:hypothetical protein L203_06332 [Cryptococcus depauperatus CBS 7841]